MSEINPFDYNELNIRPVGSTGSDWQSNFTIPNYNFYSVKNEFDEYWKGIDDTSKRGYKVFKRWENFWENRVDEDGLKPEPDTLKSLIENGTFTQSQTNIWTYIDIQKNRLAREIGRVNNIRVLPGSTMSFFACTPAGGLWKTTNKGKSWYPLGTDFLGTLGVSDVAIDPNNHNIMYISTGDSSGHSTDGIGVLKSVDGGITWNTTGLNWQISEAREASRVIIHPDDSNILICTTDNGIWRTTNAGDTWIQSYSTVDSVSNFFRELKVSPEYPNIWIASSSIIVRSTNGGITWNICNLSGPALINYDDSKRISIDFSKSEPNIVYAVGVKGNGGLSHFFKSENFGVDFFALFSNSPNYLGSNLDESGGQSLYCLGLAVDPNDSNTIYMGGIFPLKNTSGGLGLWKLPMCTTNILGQTGSLTGPWVNYQFPTIFTGEEHKADTQMVHVDIQSLSFIPDSNTSSSTLLITSDGGVNFSDDGLLSIYNISDGLGINHLYDVSTSRQNSHNFLVGKQDNGTTIKIDNVFTKISGGDGMKTIMDPSDDSIRYYSQPYGSIKRRYTYNVIELCNSDGSNFTINENANWVTPYVLDDYKNVYIGKKKLYKIPWIPGSSNFMQNFDSNYLTYSSSNYIGFSYSSSSGNLLGGGTTGLTPSYLTNIDNISIAPSNNKIIYVSKKRSIGGSGLFKSVDNGVNFLMIATSSTTISSISISDIDSDSVCFTTSGYEDGKKVFCTSDGGISWSNISGALPNLNANVVKHQPGTTSGIYVGMDAGIFYRNDDIGDFIFYNQGLPNSPVTGIDIDGNNNIITISTLGRGVWRAPLYTAV